MSTNQKEFSLFCETRFCISIPIEELNKITNKMCGHLSWDSLRGPHCQAKCSDFAGMSL